MNPSASRQTTGLLERLTSQFIPEDFEKDTEQHFRARVVVALSFAVSIFGPIYAVLVYLLTGSIAQLIATIVATTGVVMTPFLMRRGFSFVVLGNWMTVFGYSLFVYVASQSLGPAVLLWQVVFLVLLAFIAGRTSALMWLVVMSLTTAYFYVSLAAAPQEQRLFTSEQILWEMSLIIGMFIAVMVLTLSYERLKSWALDQFRKKEAHTRAILEAAPDGIITVSNDDRIGEFNPAAEELFGYEQAAVEQAPMTTLVPDLEGAPPARGDDDMAEGTLFEEDEPERRDSGTGFEAWIGDTNEAEAVRKDGERFPIELSVTPIEEQAQEDRRLVAILRDITERKEAQEKLEDARDTAVEANEAKSRFLANISHELRTPLNAIIGYSELVCEDLQVMGEAALGDDVAKIETAGRHLLALINEILDLSKMEAGKMELYVENVEVQTVVGEITDTLKPMIDENDNTLRVDIADAPHDMRVDRMKLRQILMNLLSNASKFTEEGLIRVHVFSEIRDGREYGVFEVIDRGIGIPEDKLEELFEAFTQADETTTREFGGTGLGLTISKHFTELMGGEIDVESKVGEGSTFRVKLPVDVDETRQDSLQIDKSQDSGADPGRVSHKSGPMAPPEAPRVLVIDDDPTVHQLMERFLTREGFAFKTTTGGKEALDVARDYQPDIITLDVLMPEIDGWKILERLKSDEKLSDIPVVMLTIINDRNMGFSLGATDYLTKPVDPTRLTEVLSSHIDVAKEQPVLIAEDDEDTREVLRRVVEQSGWETICVTDGREALDELDSGVVPGAILLDLMMPRLDGFQVLEALRAREDDDIPVIVVSAADVSEAERQMLDKAADKVFAKGDYAKQQLIDELEVALRKNKC